MVTLAIYVTAHMVGAVVGFWLIARIARSTLSNRHFWIVTGLLTVAMGVFVLSISEPPRFFKDFYTAYFAAGEAVLSSPEALRPQLEKGVNGFVNLPIVAYLFAPLALLPYRAAGLALFALGVAATLLAWDILRRRYAFDRLESGITLFALSTFGPLAYSMREGNISHILLLPLVLGLSLASARRDILAGAAFAAAAIIKPPLVLIGGYYLLRGRLRLVAGAVGLGVVVVALSLLVFGWDMHLVWIREFIAYSGRPMPGYNDQSIASALLRYERGVSSFRDWAPDSLSQGAALLNIGLILSLAVGGGWAACRPLLPKSPLNEDIEPMMVLTLICVASTVSWSHYYVWLTPALAILFVVSRRDPSAQRLRAWVWTAFALAAPAIFLGLPLEQGVFGHKLSSILVSYLLIAGLLIYALLIMLRLPREYLSQLSVSPRFKVIDTVAAALHHPTVYLPSLLTATIFVVVSFAIINLCFVLTNQPSTFKFFSKWLFAEASYDSWQAMRMAFQWLREPHSVTVYQEIFFNQHSKFQYPLTSLLSFTALDFLGIEPFDYRLNRLNALLQLFGALAGGALSVVMLRRIVGLPDSRQVLTALLFGMALFVFFYPTMRAYELGQVQVWINTLFSFAGVIWLLGRKFIVGMLIGVICLIKPQFSLFLIWALVRREWGFMAGWAAVVIPGLAMSVYLFGFANHWDYLSVLQFLSQRGEVFYANQSINGLLNRLLGNGVSQYFYPHEFPPYSLVVHVGTIVSSLGLIAVVLFYRPKNGFFDFLIAGLGFTIASPIAWEHHFGILPIYFAALFLVIVSLPPDIRRKPLLITLGVCFVIAGNFFAELKPLGPGIFSLLQSYLLFAAGGVLWLLYRLRDQLSWEREATATGVQAPLGP